ncbi:MAG: MBL fold metallo-hydrolase [Ferruginibacter sp.]
MKAILFLFIASLVLITISCHQQNASPLALKEQQLPDRFLVVLGIAQDAGYPQIGCKGLCCAAYWNGKEEKKHITCLALVDRSSNKYWLFEATPDITEQLYTLQSFLKIKDDYSPAGIFITHAHIGHYSGLMQLGREAMGATAIPVWAMPRLDSFLVHNGPWSQLVSLNNIALQQLHADSAVKLSNEITVTPFTVPHRDEFSETVGYIIASAQKKILFIPDIDKWEKWNRNITNEIKKVDIAFIDGTFYKNGELTGRDVREVPHPFVSESMSRFNDLQASEKAKIRFIHFNHTNPLLKTASAQKDSVFAKGYGIAEEGMIIKL